MRSDLEGNKARDTEHFTMLLGVEEKALSGNYTIESDGIMGHIFDPNGADRTITLPAHKRGKLIVIANSGTANSLAVNNASAILVATVYFGETHFFFGTTTGWVSTPDVFSPAGASASSGLVPKPPATGGAVGSERYLCEDGTWRNPGFAGNNAYATISDGTTTATASGSDNIKFRTANNRLAIAVTDNDATHGDNVLFTLNEANIDHNALTNYIADQHVAHSGVNINTAANSGLAGGGTIAASRSLTVDINNLALTVPVLADSFAFYDADGLVTGKATLTTLNGILDHNALLNYVADQHVAHSGVSITAGVGLTGGGTIAATRTISLDITGQVNAVPALANEIIYYDTVGLDFNKCTFTQLNGVIDHNSLLNYVATRHGLHPTSTDNAVARYDGVTGDLQNSGVIVSDTNDLSGIVNVTMTGYLDLTEIAAPANPAANVARFYAKDNGSGTTRLYFRDSAGTETGLGLSDGDKGDITVSSVGAVLTIDNSAVTYAKIQNVSATDRLLGRSTAGAGVVEEIVCTATGRSILDDASVAAVATTLGLGTGDSPQFTAINLGHASDTTIVRSAAGTVTVEGKQVLLDSQTALISAGFTLTPYSLGNMTSFTPAAANGNYQYGTNNAAFTLTAPSADCAIDILVTNHATTAGAITFSGFTAPSGGGGDTYATTGSNKYLLMIRRINSISTYLWKALQ